MNFLGAVDDDQPKKSTKRQKWILLRTFNDEAECREFIKALEIWSVCKHNSTATYTVIYYRCNGVPMKGQCCESQLKVFIYKNQLKEEIYVNNKEHTHDDIKTTKVSSETKATIMNMHMEGVSSNQIAHILPDSHLTTKQILNVISNERKRNNLSGDVDIAAVRQWLGSQNKIPEDECQPYISKFETSSFGENQFVRFLYTSKKLLSNIVISDLLCIDTTHKVTTTNLPLYVIGTIDRGKHFHFVAVGCCTKEQTEDFRFIFSAVKEASFQIGIHLRPRVLLSDGCMALINAFYSEFDTAVTNNMCHVHVMRNAEKHLKGSEMSVDSKKMKTKIIEQFKIDFFVLQTSSSKEKFEFAWKLFKEKYEKISKEFILYFEQQWLKQPRLSVWYEGANDYEMHNNALESTNKVIKQKYIRSKLPFDLFSQRLGILVMDYSNSYAIDRKIQNVPDMTEGMYRVMAYVSQNKFLKECAQKDDTSIQIFYAKTKEFVGNIDAKAIKSFRNPQHTSFDEYSEFVSNFFRIEYNHANYLDSKCTCAVMLKSRLCGHIMLIAFQQNKLIVPEDFNFEIYSKKRGVGRPKKRGPALSME